MKLCGILGNLSYPSQPEQLWATRGQLWATQYSGMAMTAMNMLVEPPSHLCTTPSTCQSSYYLLYHFMVLDIALRTIYIMLYYIW